MPRFLTSLIVLLLMAIFAQGASAAVNPDPYSTNTTTFSPKVLNLLNLAQARVQAGKVVEAAYLLNLAHNVEPNNPFILARLAVVLNMVGDNNGALDRLRRAQKMGATNDVVLAPMLDAMLSLGQNQNVLDLFPDPGAPRGSARRRCAGRRALQRESLPHRPPACCAPPS